jgi:uncharacterized integral membrane protein (TIGR00698 family)
MNSFKQISSGFFLCVVIALPAWYFGQLIPVIGGPVFGILFGLSIALIPRKAIFFTGIKFTSKKILQYAIILLGFGMNLFDIFEVGSQSLIIILSTISTSLLVAFLMRQLLNTPSSVSTLIGVGSSICGGSAIAATAPVIEADDEDIAKSISVIFLFNVLAAFLFPVIGNLLKMSDIGFGMFAGTAINDTSSVVAAGQTWSNMQGNDTALQYATIVKLTRTLAIIPITLILAFYRTHQENTNTKISIKKLFPWFILYFLIASVITTAFNMPPTVYKPLTQLGKFMITMAMVAIGLNTNLVKLIKTGGKPILLGLTCWISIAIVSLLMQQILGIW